MSNIALSLSDEERVELLDNFWDHAIQGKILVNDDFTIRYANPAFCEMIEYNEVELQKMTVGDITLPEDLQVDIALANKAKAGEIHSYDLYKHYITKTKKVKLALLRVVAIRLSDGHFRFFYSQIAPAQVVMPTGHIQSASKMSNASIRTGIWWRANWQWVLAGMGVMLTMTAAIGSGLAAFFNLVRNHGG